ncbi:LuxR family transcriptional regulator [Streptomyces sp. NPDC050263]|uniref:LuxR family transcriptional regulator n=1 Tax=Streptomyces sp. NPDC050263 TaxID=3155037 RepID=UPI00343ABB1C
MIRVFGRECASDEMHRRLSDPDGPRLVVVRGERGVGRTAFVRAAGDRLRAQGTPVSTVECVPGDTERPLLLALRLVMVLEEHRYGPERQGVEGHTLTRAAAAVDRRDQAAMRALLCAALTRSTRLAVLIDDAQYADPASLALLGMIAVLRPLPDVRLVVAAAQHVERSAQGTAPGGDGPGGAVARPAGTEGTWSVVLSRLAPEDTTALVRRRLGATPDARLARRVHELTRGIPGAVDALITGWDAPGGIQVLDGHAFVGTTSPPPVLPEHNVFMTALDALGEPFRAVAAALSILGPLGRPALELTALWTGLSADSVGDALRGLVGAGIVDELPGPDGTAVQGWTFRLPLTAHSVRERLRPMERCRLSALAVEALWAAADADVTRAGVTPPPEPILLGEADARTYPADRVADAGSLVDPERAVAELTAAAERMPPGTDDQAVLRWLLAAANLIEQPAARVAALQRSATAAYVAGDNRSGRTITAALLRHPGASLTATALQQAACQLAAATANQRDWPALARLATTRWWDELPVPAPAKVCGRALALCRLARWQEAVDLLTRTAGWHAGPRDRAVPKLLLAAAELALGRPESFRRELAMAEASELPPGMVHALATAMFDELLVGHDVNAARALLNSRQLTVEALPPLSRFLWHHLTGRWDQALESARGLPAHQTQVPGSDSFLLPARTAAILLARGRVTSALRMVERVSGPEEGPPRCSLHSAEAEVHMALGDLKRAERTLRRGLDAARAHAQTYGTEELWAPLAEVTARTGRTAEALTCLGRLERIAARTDSGRARLRYLLASAQVLPKDAPRTAHGTACEQLREAVDLARSRGLPFETANVFVAAAALGAGPAALLREAYELFGVTGAALWRFRTRAAMREARVVVPGRKQATAENEQLLATLVVEGLTNRQIAIVLGLNEEVVANRLSRLFARTGVRSRTELVTAVHKGAVWFV